MGGRSAAETVAARTAAAEKKLFNNIARASKLSQVTGNGPAGAQKGLLQKLQAGWLLGDSRTLELEKQSEEEEREKSGPGQIGG